MSRLKLVAETGALRTKTSMFVLDNFNRTSGLRRESLEAYNKFRFKK